MTRYPMRKDVLYAIAHEIRQGRVTLDQPEKLFDALISYGLLPEEFDELFPTRRHAVRALKSAQDIAAAGWLPPERPSIVWFDVARHPTVGLAERLALSRDFHEDPAWSILEQLRQLGFDNKTLKRDLGTLAEIRHLLYVLRRDVAYMRRSVARRWAAEARQSKKANKEKGACNAA